MNEVSTIFIKSFDTLITQRIKKLNIPSIFKAVIINVNEDGTYSIIYKKKKYNIKCGLGIALTKGQLVWITIPDKNIKNMYISALR